MDDVLKVLQPIWAEKMETATKLRGRLEEIIAPAIVVGHRADNTNPARWKGNLSAALPKPGEVMKVTNHPANALDDAAPWFAALRRRGGIAARALEFLAITAARSGEVRGAVWDEFDLEAATWTTPAERMKRTPKRGPARQSALLLRQRGFGARPRQRCGASPPHPPSLHIALALPPPPPLDTMPALALYLRCACPPTSPSRHPSPLFAGSRSFSGVLAPPSPTRTPRPSPFSPRRPRAHASALPPAPPLPLPLSSPPAPPHPPPSPPPSPPPQMGREHRVRLSPAAVSTVRAMPEATASRYVFSAQRGGQLSWMTISAVMRRMHRWIGSC